MLFNIIKKALSRDLTFGTCLATQHLHVQWDHP